MQACELLGTATSKEILKIIVMVESAQSLINIKVKSYSGMGLGATSVARATVLLRLIFAPKMKTAPQRDLGAEVVKDLPLFGPEEWSFFDLELTQSR